MSCELMNRSEIPSETTYSAQLSFLFCSGIKLNGSTHPLRSIGRLARVNGPKVSGVRVKPGSTSGEEASWLPSNWSTNRTDVFAVSLPLFTTLGRTVNWPPTGGFVFVDNPSIVSSMDALDMKEPKTAVLLLRLGSCSSCCGSTMTVTAVTNGSDSVNCTG